MGAERPISGRRSFAHRAGLGLGGLRVGRPGERPLRRPGHVVQVERLGDVFEGPDSAALTAVIRLFCALITMIGSFGRCLRMRGST